MSGCLRGLIQEDLSKFGCVSDELALQVRAIAMVCVQAICKTDKALWLPSSLHLAAYYDSVELLEILIEVFNYEEAMALDGSTPAQFAAMKGHLRALAILYRNVDISIYCCVGGFNAYEFLKSFAKRDESEKLPCLSRIYACGDNSTVSLGIVYGKCTKYPVPVQFFDEPSFGKEVTQVSFGKYHTIYLIDGRAYSCGLGRYGKLGHGDEKDQLEIRGIKFLETIVCVCAGPTHSVICTRKKIVVFGLNNKGQLGLGTKQLVLTPTVAKSFKENPGYIIDCSTAESLSVIIMSNFDFYVTGTSNGFLWRRYSGNTFKHVGNNYAHQTSSISVTDSSLIRIYAKEDTSKITIKVDGKNYYITSSIHITRCIGIYYTPALGALFFGFNYFYENRPHAITSGIFLFDSEYHGLIRPVYFYSTLMKRSIIEVASADVTRNGQIIIVDYIGDVYEGNLANYTLCLDPYFCNSNDDSSWDTTDHIIKVKVNRLRGILSAKSAFLTPDGRNMVLNLVEVDPRSVLRCMGNVSQAEFPSDSIAVIICMDENGDELGRYETSLEMLKHESDVCSSYFERWAGNQNNEIRITGKPELLEIFLSFCCDHCLRANLSMQELMELLIFADKLICKSFFNAIMKELFRPPFEMSNLRDLFALARYLSSMELYQSLSELCAAIFPTLLENGFVNELLLDEILYIEDAFRSYALQNIAHTVDMFESKIKKLVVPEQTVRNIIMDVMAVVKEPMDMKSLINFCKTIKADSLPKKRRKHMGSSRTMVDMEAMKNCGLQDSSTNEKNDGCLQMPNIFSKIAFKPVDIEKKYPSLSDVQIAIATNEVCENGILETHAFASVSGTVTEREGKTVKIKQKEKCPHISPRSTSKNTYGLQRRTSNSWHLDESMICGNSFAQIMEDEQARQLETIRQARCRLSDINMEEQAIAELTAQYEGEATMQGVSITVSTEREVEKVNDPLWAARS
uniref:ANK_REP_REGION domain-containing protein n=2 Tax=Wuchereria bancrofti TaxID=6293 RepID=A0AAF5PH55_WUCBA